jgi:rod shape determining protein RodA
MSQMIKSPAKKTFTIDWTLSLILLSLTAVSLIAIYGASPLLISYLDGTDLLIKQSIWIAISIISLVLLIQIGVDRLFTAIDIAYWILIGLLILLILDRYINLPFISPVNGTRAWFQLPGLGTLQPSEFMKAVIIIKASIVISEHIDQNRVSNIESDLFLFYKILKFIALPLFLIILQPDTGIPIIIVIGLIAMLAMSGIQRFWIILGVAIGTIGIISALILFFFAQDLLIDVVGSSYRLNRFYGWLQTEQYISSWGLQLYQSLLAVGSAGWLGHGLGSQVITLIEPQNDFIFAVIGQNFGFIGASFVLFLHLSLDMVIIRIISNNEYYREKIMAVGLLGMLLFQQIQNMGMIIGLLPITGITLPFVSAGGSSLLSFIPTIAILFHMNHLNRSKILH